MARAQNYRLAKIHRNYTVEEAAALYGVHKNTVRGWLRCGLSTIDQRRPALILGLDLAEFLRMRRQNAKRPCRPSEIYCMRCREPRTPALGMVEYESIGLSRGRLIALCPCCGSLIYRSVNPARLPSALASMTVTVPAGRRHISEST